MLPSKHTCILALGKIVTKQISSFPLVQNEYFVRLKRTMNSFHLYTPNIVRPKLTGTCEYVRIKTGTLTSKYGLNYFRLLRLSSVDQSKKSRYSLYGERFRWFCSYFSVRPRTPKFGSIADLARTLPIAMNESVVTSSTMFTTRACFESANDCNQLICLNLALRERNVKRKWGLKELTYLCALVLFTCRKR